MHFRAISRITGLFIMLFSGTLLIPELIALFYQEKVKLVFIQTFVFSITLGFLLYFPNRFEKGELNVLERFFFIPISWIVLGSIGALPLILLRYPDLTITNAFFESFSGLTTTGASIIIELDLFPHAILFYRQMLQWLGGTNIILLSVAISPILSFNKLKLDGVTEYFKGYKIHSFSTRKVKVLWLIYVSLTVICALLLWIAGMSIFDAISHSFATIAMGGFSTHNSSIGYFNSPIINIIIAIFSLIANYNYNLYFAIISNCTFRTFWNNLEFKIFLFIQLVLLIICVTVLHAHRVYDTALITINQAFFHVVSMTTTAGFTADDITQWPFFLSLLLISSSFIGRCIGLTGGGLKVIHIFSLFKQNANIAKHLIYLNNFYYINKISGQLISSYIFKLILKIFIIYTLVFIFSFFIIVISGIDRLSAFTSVVTTLNNLGPGLGIIADNFASINPLAKWILILNMLFGRIGILNFLILLKLDQNHS